jgi:hypothetical protein
MLTAVSPLSYNSFWTMEKNAKGIDMKLVERAVSKLAKKVKKSLNIKLDIKFSVNFPNSKDIKNYPINYYYVWNNGTQDFDIVELDEPLYINKSSDDTKPSITDKWGYSVGHNEYNAEGDYWYYVIDNYYATIPAYDEDGNFVTLVIISQAQAQFDPIFAAIQDGLTISGIEDISDQINGQIGNTVDNVAARFESYIERISNKYVAAMKNHALTRAVSPIILYEAQDGIHRMIDGTTVNAGYMTINMTSATKERIVPPYEKYIAVKDASGKIIQSATVPGNTQLLDLDLTKAGDYTIILSCMDYYGYVVTKKYDITVK